MTIRSYSSAAAFKEALEQRLKSNARSGVHLQRQRQLLIYDRFLARATSELGDALILKGGLCLEFRLGRARTTRDVDLRVSGSPDAILEKLQAATRINLNDFLSYQVVRDERHPTIQNDGLQYEGMRFRVECKLAGKLYGQRFGLDVAFGDPIFGEVTAASALDHLGFIGVAPPQINLYPVGTHIAEKLHAYTVPRTRPNSRVKDASRVRQAPCLRLKGALVFH